MSERDADEIIDELCEAAQASEDLSNLLRRVSQAATDLMSSGLKERAILLLLQDKTGIRRGDIQAVLRALPRLNDYLVDGKK